MIKRMWVIIYIKYFSHKHTLTFSYQITVFFKKLKGRKAKFIICSDCNKPIFIKTMIR